MNNLQKQYHVALCGAESSLNSILMKEGFYKILNGTHAGLMSLTKGSNLGPPGMAMLRAFAVKKLLKSNR